MKRLRKGRKSGIVWLGWVSVVLVLVLVSASCSSGFFLTPTNQQVDEQTLGREDKAAVIDQKPVPIKVDRVDSNEVDIEMTAQITNVEIAQDVSYNAWTFNGTVPGPIIRVKEGDQLNFTLQNKDPHIPHSMDFHAVFAAPDKDFADVAPDESGQFTYKAGSPGVYMYHCGTDPILQHIANGMYGTIIVEPGEGYPTDEMIDGEFVMTQSEWYKEHDWQDMLEGDPDYVVFNGKANQYNADNPLEAKTGERIRIYVNNAGPNEVSSIHVVGTILDTIYIDGDPRNVQHGMQTVMLPASGGAVIEFEVNKPGVYPILTHQFNHASKGAVAVLQVTD